MITQTTICLKVDSFNLEQLDQECHVSAKKRNRAINEAIASWVRQQDDIRRAKMENRQHSERTIREATDLMQYIEEGLTCSELSRLEHIAAGMGRSRNYTIAALLRQAISDYDKRPFSYL